MTGSMGLVITAGAASHTGNRRTRNEDAVHVGTHVFAVADGMGGHDAGDQASRLAIENLDGLGADGPVRRSDVLDRVRDGHAEIRSHVLNGTSGTTIAGIAVIDQPGTELLVFHVGDSRVYRLRSGSLTLLTRDHSVIQELIDAGRLDIADAEHHPERHVITRSLGSRAPLQIDWRTEAPRPGDRYLIASDGLTNELSDTTIAEELQVARPPEGTATALVERTLAGPATDNVSAVVVDIVSTPPANPGPDDDPLAAATGPAPTHPVDRAGIR